jgi:hypothetical protein
MAGTIAEVAAWFWLAPALAVAAPLWGARGVAGAMSSSYAFSFGALLIIAAVLGELKCGQVFVTSPRAAWHRLRLFATARSP